MPNRFAAWFKQAALVPANHCRMFTSRCSKRRRHSRQLSVRRPQTLRVNLPFFIERSSQSIFFVKADVAEDVEFIAVLGPNIPASVTINELTTVAASYSMAQFLRTGVISGNSFGLQLAAGMNDNIVTSATGQSSPILLNSPNADQTNSLRSTRSLANLLAACVNDPGVTASLFDLTTPPGGLPPHNAAQALANLARDPGQNVAGIYALTLLSNLYTPRACYHARCLDSNSQGQRLR